MHKLSINILETWYSKNFEEKLFGQYITFDMIEPFINNLGLAFEKDLLGYSAQSRPIYKISIGKGKKQVLAWSQMHGNESTGTKALFDLFKFLSTDHEMNAVKERILEQCTFVCIPMLNPDGAEVFTRHTSEGIDLNRDVLALKAQESMLLNETLKKVYPQFCFNLHDQRTIFNVEKTNNPATISFLAPSVDEQRTITDGRKITMSVIVAMNTLLQKVIPNQVGRYTDEFYPAAAGDNFQKAGHNTILIEAGHYKNDYDRDIVRKFNFYALLEGLNYIASNDQNKEFVYEPYFNIPKNDKQCYDIIYRKARFPDKKQTNDLAFQYDYTIKNKKLILTKKLEKIGYLNSYFGHEEIDCTDVEFDVKKILNS